MSDPENGKAPPREDQATTGDEEPENAAGGDKRKTMKGMGANLRLPRPRASTVHSVKPASVQEHEEPQRSRPESKNGGWQSVPLTELSIPSPADVRDTTNSRPAPPDDLEADSEPDEFEAEATQMADGLVVAIEDLSDEVVAEDDFEAEATQLGIPEEFIEEDAGLHENRLGVARTAAFGSIDQQADSAPGSDAHSFGEVKRSTAEYRKEQPLPEPIRSAPLAEPPPATGHPAGEFENEKTEVLNSPFDSEPAVAKLHVLEGPIAGQEFFVTQLRNTIGRGESNSIMMADPAMSRQHLEIVKNPDDTYTLRDLQSVNGTGLNGTRIRECDLYHGDRIEAGKSVFQFLVRGAGKQAKPNRHLIPAASATMSGGFPAMDPRPALTPGGESSEQLSKLWTIITVAAGIISMILLVAIVFLLVDGGLPGMSQAQPEQSASELYLEAVEAVKSRDWSAAETKFARAKELDEGLSIDAQLERIETEKAARQSYEQLLEKYKAGKYEAVARLAETIPAESVYREEALELASKREKFATDAVYARAQAAATREDHEEALQHLEQVLQEAPSHRGALSLKSRVEEEIQAKEKAELEEPAVVATKSPKKRSGFDLDLDKPPSTSSGSSSKSRIINFTRGYTLYRSKKFDEAAEFFADIGRNRSGPGATRAARAAEDIRSFESGYQSGKRDFAAGNWSSARSSLKSAYRADSSVSGGRGYHRKEIASMLATTEANLGLQALASKRYAEAQKKLKTARAHESSAPDVRELDKRLSSEARTLYIKAANLRKKDPRVAAELCRDIMAMTDASDTTHQKAKALLKDL